MEPYENSPNREQIRLKHYSNAQPEEQLVKMNLQNNLNKIEGKAEPIPLEDYYFVVPVIFIAVVLVNALFGIKFNIIVGTIIATIAYRLLSVMNAARKNASREAERQKLRDEADKQIADLYLQADNLTLSEVAAYDGRVRSFRDSCKPSSISRIVTHTADVFMRAEKIAERNAGDYMQFVEFDFQYDVMLDRIEYKYKEEVDINDTFSFVRQHYRNLDDSADAEGLAAVLMKGTLGRLRPVFQGRQARVSNDHRDALVTIHFRMPNSRYIPTTQYS